MRSLLSTGGPQRPSGKNMELMLGISGRETGTGTRWRGTCLGTGGKMVSDSDRLWVRGCDVFSVAFPVSSFPLPTLL